MNQATNRFLLWAPRVLALLVIAFLSLFAVDAFEPGTSIARSLAALLIHLMPSFVLIAVVALAWRRPWVGALAFALAATGYAFSAGRHHLDWIAIISGPLLLTAVLFCVSGFTRRGAAPVSG